MTNNEGNSQDSKTGLAIGTLALGAIAGAIAGILFAPKSGKETRDELMETLNKVKDDVTLKLSEAKDVTQETYHSIVESVLQTYRDTKQLTSDQAEKIRGDLQDGYEDVKLAVVKTADDIQAKTPGSM